VTTSNPQPWPGGWWRLRDIVEYEKIGYTAVLKAAARNHELFQRASIRAARDAVEKGRAEPPFAWLVPADQRDPGTAARLLELLHYSGVEVHRAEEAFTADGVAYPEGTSILYAAQPYRTYVKDLLERQEPPTGPTPNRFESWTLPLQMGVRCATVDAPFACKVKKLDAIPRPQARLEEGDEAVSYLVKAGANDDYRLINRIYRERIDLSFVTSAAAWESRTGERVPAGSLFIADGEGLREKAPEILAGLSSALAGTRTARGEADAALQSAVAPRVGLYRPWMENLDEGWTRFVLDTGEFRYSSVRNPEVRAGELRDRYDCLILPSISARALVEGQAAGATEPRYVGGIGREGAANLQRFALDGGTLVCIDAACNAAIELLALPVASVLAGLPHEKFFCRGSSLRIRVDPDHPVGYGLPEWASAFFYEAQAFDVAAHDTDGVAAVARYAETALVESGRIRSGQELIAGKAAIAEVACGAGRVVLLGFRVQRNGQTHGTFRLLYNAIQRSTLGG
jgi:hypothetical protein